VGKEKAGGHAILNPKALSLAKRYHSRVTRIWWLSNRRAVVLASKTVSPGDERLERKREDNHSQKGYSRLGSLGRGKGPGDTGKKSKGERRVHTIRTRDRRRWFGTQKEGGVMLIDCRKGPL